MSNNNAQSIVINDALTEEQAAKAKVMEDMQDNVAHFAKELRSEIKQNTRGEYTIPAFMVKSLDEVLKKWTDAGEDFIKSLRNPR